MILIKKYRNRRLYDTSDSRYVTLDELAAKVRSGTDVQVVDASSGEDLTQATLAQIIFESRGAAKLLPAPLLTRLIRLGDVALAEFLGRYVTWSLDLYIGARQGAQAIAPYNPLATLPFTATDALARLLGHLPGLGSQAAPPPPPPPVTAEPPPPSVDDELAALRREVEALKATMGDRAESAD